MYPIPGLGGIQGGREGGRGGVTCVRVMNEDCGSEGASRCTRYLG